MSVTWTFREELLVVTEAGSTPFEDLRRAFVDEALADARASQGQSTLWDARGSHSVMGDDDIERRIAALKSLAESGRIARFALLLRPSQGMTAELYRSELPKAVYPLEFSAFTDEADAAAWLERR